MSSNEVTPSTVKIISGLGKEIEISIGDNIILKYNGYRGVPHYLDLTRATIEKINRKKIVVNPVMYDGLITIRQDQIRQKLGDDSK